MSHILEMATHRISMEQHQQRPLHRAGAGGVAGDVQTAAALDSRARSRIEPAPDPAVMLSSTVQPTTAGSELS